MFPEAQVRGILEQGKSCSSAELPLADSRQVLENKVDEFSARGELQAPRTQSLATTAKKKAVVVPEKRVQCIIE